DVYNKADLIISKGQGNLEGLLENTREDIFFLLMVKCNVIGDLINVKEGDFVVRQNIKKKK
nr:ARMT1-like domain-containing protein [Bacteroidales bacterium]